MKHARKALIILVIFVTPLLLSGLITSIPSGEVTELTSPTKVSVLSYETHGPIDIDNDTDFYDTAAAESWDGDGSPGDPYIIEGYNITAAGTCIAISDVTYSFEIRGCYLTSVSAHVGDGININNATEVVVFNTTINVKEYSMALMDIDSLEIQNCTTDYCVYGLYIWECEGAIVEECVVKGMLNDCLHLFLCNNSVVTGNEIWNAVTGTGVRVLLSHHVTIFDSEIYGCSDSGIYAADSPYLTVEECDIHDNWYGSGPMCGVHLDNSDYASVIGNEIYHNARNGIYFGDSDFVYIFDNHIYDNTDHGIDAIFSVNGTIIQNNIHGNGFDPQIINEICGIYLGPTINFSISDNMIWNNTPAGISLVDSSHITVSNNEIFNNTHTGIYGMTAAFGTESVFCDNRIYGNGFSETLPLYLAGIYLDGYTYTTIENNHVYNNTRDGISSRGDYNNIIGNTVYDNNNSGIVIWESYDNIASGNIVFDNDRGFDLVTIGTNLTRNIVYDNDVGIFADYIGYCYMYENDIGWNNINAIELSAEVQTYWHNNESIGNWWSDYSGVGVYNITNGIGVVNQDLYPSKSLDLNQSASIDFEILETGNVILWEAQALNPSHYEVYVDSELVLTETWDGGDIEYLADGLSHGMHTIELEVYHISGHSMGNSTTADVEDLTPPELDGPSIIETTVGGFFNVQYTAVDPSGISSWAVNDTRFAIDSSGVLSRVGELSAGEHAILIQVTDTLGHTASMEVTVLVSGGGIDTALALSIGGGAIVVLVVVIVILKKKQT